MLMMEDNLEGGTLDAVVTGQQGGNQVKQDAADNKATTPPKEQKSPEKAQPEVPEEPEAAADTDPPAEAAGGFPNKEQEPAHTNKEQAPAHADNEPAPAQASKPKTTGARAKDSAGTTQHKDNQSWRRFSVSDTSAFETGINWNKETTAEMNRRQAREAEFDRTMQYRADEAVRHSLERSSWESRNRNNLFDGTDKPQPTVGTKKKKKPAKHANSSTFKERLAEDETFLDILTNLHMEKQPIVKLKSMNSPHMKVEPTFIGELKTEIETMLNRQLEADEDILAITISVLRQGICQTYLTSDSLTDSIEAAEQRRGTRNSGVNQEAEREEMIAQLELNHQNMSKMEELLNQVRRHMSQAQAENISPCMYLDELPRNVTQTSSRASTTNHTRHSTKTHTRTSTTTGTPLRKTTSNTPGQGGGNPKPEGISEAITQLTKKMQITDPDRIIHPAPLLKLATAVNPTTPRRTYKQGSTATPNRHGNPKTTPTGVNKGGKAPKQTQAAPPATAKKVTPTNSTNNSASSISAITSTTNNPVNTVQTPSSQDSDSGSGKYYRNVEPRLFTGKQYDDVEMFLRNINRFMQRAKITNNDEKVDYLHKHLTTEVRIILNKTLTWEETCDYEAQVAFLRKWWPRPDDLEPLRDEFNRMKLSMTETVEEYARRIQMQRSAGWPDESKVSRRGMQSDFEKGVVEGLIRGLPKGLRQQVETSSFMDTFEIGHHTIDDLLKYIKIQMRNMEKRARAFCKHCGKNSGHSTEECTRNKKVTAVKQTTPDDEAVSNYSTISEDVEPKPYEIYCCEEYTVNAVYPQDDKPKASAPAQQPFRQPFKKPFMGNQNNFRNAAPQGNFRPRFPGPPQRKPMNPDLKKFIVCYNCGEEGHYSKECTSEKVKQPEGPVTVEEMREMLKSFDNIKRILWRGIRYIPDDQVKLVTQECMDIDDRIMAIELQIEEALAVKPEIDPLNK